MALEFCVHIFCSAAKASYNVATICGHVRCVCVCVCIYIWCVCVCVLRHRLLTQKSSVTSLKCCSLFESASCLSSLAQHSRIIGHKDSGQMDGRTDGHHLISCCVIVIEIYLRFNEENPVFPSLCTRACPTSLLGNFNGFSQLSIFISEMNESK